jgi:acetate kinase
MESKLILITNPGSSSRKYALYDGDAFLASLHFEFENDKIICNLANVDGVKTEIPVHFDSLAETVAHIHKILEDAGYITPAKGLSAVLARVAASGDFFTSDRIVDDEYMINLEAAKNKSPLHVPVIAAEIAHFRKSFPDTPILAMSDSAFHWSKPDLMKYYPFDTDLADKAEIKRYGFHGLSVGFVVEYLKSADLLPEKLIVCHIGSGSSVSAVFGGTSMDTSMGYSPLEGVMMSTRSGSLDVAAALAIKRALKLEDDEALEKYLNKKAGLLGVSGGTDDMRLILQKRDEGDKKATFAHALYVYRLQSLIGQMAASLGGVDAVAFTATIGERSSEIRHYITQKLAYLGFQIDLAKNENPTFEGRHAEIAADNSKPLYIVKTDESAEMIRKARFLLDTPK